jgi:hypothetical protein
MSDRAKRSETGCHYTLDNSNFNNKTAPNGLKRELLICAPDEQSHADIICVSYADFVRDVPVGP